MEYAHEKAQAALKALIASNTDTEIATALTAAMMIGARAPFVFAINHNAKAAPCPVKIDKAGAKSCSVALRNPAEATQWCINALLHGYEIRCGTARGQEIHSVAAERRSIQHRADMAAYRLRRETDPKFKELDDEIPF